MELTACLSDYRRYQRQIERLHKKHLFTRQLYLLEQDGVSLATLNANAVKVAKLVAKSVAGGQYRFQPARVRKICVNRKEREVFSYGLTDLIVHNTIAEIIQEAISPFFSPNLYSYRKGVSWWVPISEFASYVRFYRKNHRDPQDRGIYVLRRDIEAYTDSIPVGPRSPVWPMVRDVLAPSGSAFSIPTAQWPLIEQVIRPEIGGEDNGLYSLIRGVPTGQSISCVLFNLYLTPLDRALERVPGAFYARYSDDILFAHSDVDVVKQVDGVIKKVLLDLELATSLAKSHNFYLTAAGRHSSAWKESQGTSWVTFLGARVSADGTISLNREKMHHLLHEIQQRAIRVARALPDADQERTGRIVCSAINKMLEPDKTLLQAQSAALVRAAVTDRTQLAELDYCIARIVLRCVTGQTGVGAFRRIPYRTIRQDWGLISLLHARNKWGRKAH